MAVVQVNGTPIHFIEQGRGPAVVLLHGFPLDHRMWMAQIDALADHYRVIAPDFRGFGQSVSTDTFTMESLADDIHALIESLSAGPAVVAGLSMGGYVALAYAKKYSNSLRGLILLDTKAQPDTPETKEGRGKMIELVKVKGAVAIGDAMTPRLVSPDTLKSKPAIVKRLREMTDHCPVKAIENGLAAMRDRPDLSDLLSTISVPTLLIVGDGDVITPPAVMEEMGRVIGSAHLAVIRASGHMPTMEQPEQTNHALRRFLDGVK